jgi:hypothetical protein
LALSVGRQSLQQREEGGGSASRQSKLSVRSTFSSRDAEECRTHAGVSARVSEFMLSRY